MIFYIS